MINWFVTHNRFIITKNSIHVLPELCFWYDKNYFLETGVGSPAFGFRIGWIKWRWFFGLQKSY